MDNDDYDTPWKEVVTHHFPEFMAFYFPSAHAAIEWSRPHAFLDQEFAALTRDAELGKRLLDKLVSVHLVDGGQQWVLVHLEVQGWHDRDFAERIFVYNYRAYDRYRRAVASLALLTDDSKRWRPDAFGYRLLGSEMGIRFPVVKLLDFADRIVELEMHPNPFALVTVAYLQARKTKDSAHRRRIAKWRLTKLLYQRDWSKQRIINLYRVIDWIMRLPQEFEARLREGILQMERRKTMTYLSSIERIGMEIGMKKGMQQGLEEGRQKGLQEGLQEGRVELLAELLARRFGELDGNVRQRLATAAAEQLSVWGANFVDARSLADVFRSG
jgi:predicted transposase YdaD